MRYEKIISMYVKKMFNGKSDEIHLNKIYGMFSMK